VDYIKNTAAKYFVSTDNYYGGRMAAEYFLKQKFNNPVIGIRKEKDGFDPIQERVNGFCDCLRENGVECRKLQLVWYQDSYAETYMRLGKFMEKNPDSDAFFCVTDDMAINLMFTLKSLGIRIPNDVSILGFDGIPRAEETYPELATIVQPTEEIAKQTFKIMKNIQEGKKVESNIVMIKPALRIRESVRNIDVKV
jgi:DNA-binding LacI/PurR family transcriptional regulator